MVAAVSRPAELSDLHELSQLLVDATAEMTTQRGGEALLASFRRSLAPSETLESAISDPNAMVWCGVWEGAVVGYSIAVSSKEGDSDIVSITDLYTTPEARDVGIGEVLLEAAIAWAIGIGATAIDAQALPGARESKNLYERLGLTARLITVRRDLR
jgi:GNAT superfamily N-acetyltransferase